MNSYSTTAAMLVGLLFTVQAVAQASPESALDTLHQAGAEANQADFTALLTEGAVFLGMDDGVRLQGKALRDFVSDSFASGKSWDYHSSQREIQLSADGSVAWFDESLQHDQLGYGRGSGVLTQTAGVWKIAQYNLMVSLPAVPLPVETTPRAAVSEADEAPKKPACRKIRHKTNKQASC